MVIYINIFLKINFHYNSKSILLFRIKTIAAQVLLAIECLHEAGIVYRDLRPENILLDEFGYIKLSDFGISKYLTLNETTLTVCGASELIAPEIILGKGYNYNVDLWQLGAFLYEIIFGIPPFFDDNTSKLYDLIVHSVLTFPDTNILSMEPQTKELSEMKDLIFKLMNKNPNLRLGCKGNFLEIKSHNAFTSINFDNIAKKKFSPIFYNSLNQNQVQNQEIKRKTYDGLNDNILPEILVNFDPSLNKKENLNISVLNENEKDLISCSKEIFEDL